MTDEQRTQGREAWDAEFDAAGVVEFDLKPAARSLRSGPSGPLSVFVFEASVAAGRG